jgi:hypothetical protein
MSVVLNPAGGNLKDKGRVYRYFTSCFNLQEVFLLPKFDQPKADI